MGIFTSLPKDSPLSAAIGRESKKLFIAGDHAGYDLKEVLKPFLIDHGYDLEDLGPHSLDLADDYPDFVLPLAQAVARAPLSRGIVLGGTGEGEAMAVNRVSGVRAVVLYSFNEKIVRLSREHNNSNVLSLGARFLSDEEAKQAVLLWLETPFTGESRHLRRITKIDAIS
ncbi:MAG: RpiB/LacA/LacB family sugar-phosphate isomerase [Patescibacteria group bacterium]